ncbi:MAG: peptidoglycan recognition family protein [Dehalococcoidia bacterium]|nr:peptidoglycan recognition family protein [Dehalococcoidia bacterium]
MTNQLTEAMEQWFPSPNYQPGRSQTIDLIIIHSTRGGAAIGVEAQATVNWFCNPRAEASTHLLITQKGQFVHFVADGDTAWGAGELNPHSLQVELEQPDNAIPFSEIQIIRLVEAVQWWGSQHDIPLDGEHVKGHDQTSQGIRQGKSDPGWMFDWPSFWTLLGA